MIEPNPALYEHKPLDTYLSTASLERPTGLHSVLNQFTRGIVGTAALGSDLQSYLLGSRTDGNKMWHDAINLLDAEQENVTGLPTKAAGFVSNLLGQTLSLAPLAGAAVGEEVVGGILGTAAKLAPKPIGFTLPKIAAAGKFVGKSARYGATFAGFAAPEAFEESYDEKTNTFNLRKASIEIGANGALGALIPSAQFLLGLLGKKLGIGIAKELAEGKQVDVSGLPKDEAQFVKDYAEDPNALDVHKDATAIMTKKGYKTDTNNHKVLLDLLTANDGENLGKVTTDPLFADVPEDLKTTTKNYILNNRLDELRADKSIADGLTGWIDHIDREIGNKELHLAEAEKGMLTGIRDNMEFSQTGIMRELGKAQFDESHLAHVPYTVPDNVLANIKIENQIRKLEAKITKQGENKKVRRRIVELEGKKPKILTPKEEIDAIHAKSSEKAFNQSKEYHRLTELASYWPQARKLLDRVHLEEAHNAQLAYRNVLDAFAKIIKGNLSPLAEPERAAKYLKTRAEQSKGDVTRPEAELTKPTEPTKPKEIGTKEDAVVERSESEELKTKYEAAKRKMKQFKQGTEAFNNMINCVLGTRNGQV